MHILILDFPLNDALVLQRSSKHLPILENLNALNHTRVAKEASSSCHFRLSHQVELEIDDFQFLYR